jgi:hypothetical protein
LTVGADIAIAVTVSSSPAHFLFFVLGAALRSHFFSLLLLSLAFGLSTAGCSNFQGRGKGGVDGRPVSWRRTEFGWEDASRWQLNATLRPLPTPATAVHPFVIAALELMISVGSLALGSHASRATRR